MIVETGAADVVVRIVDATVVRPNGEAVFEGLSWTVREGEPWAIVGPVGSGKTALTDVLLGRLRVTAGALEWPLVDRLRAAGRRIGWPSEFVSRVGFKEESRLFSYGRHYYQQRYNFIEPDDDLTLDQFLHGGADVSEDELNVVCDRLGIAGLRGLSFIKLSNGQTRRARIARALLAHPEVLILDEPFIGLDADGRREVGDLLHSLARGGTRLILVTAADAVPPWVTHVLELAGRRVTYSGPRASYRAPATGDAAGLMWNSDAARTEPVVELTDVNRPGPGVAVRQPGPAPVPGRHDQPGVRGCVRQPLLHREGVTPGGRSATRIETTCRGTPGHWSRHVRRRPQP